MVDHDKISFEVIILRFYTWRDGCDDGCRDGCDVGCLEGCPVSTT